MNEQFSVPFPTMPLIGTGLALFTPSFNRSISSAPQQQFYPATSSALHPSPFPEPTRSIPSCIFHFVGWILGCVDDDLSYLGNLDAEGILMDGDLEMGIGKEKLPQYEELFPAEDEFLDETKEMRNQQKMIQELKEYFLQKDQFIDKELKRLGL